MSEINTRVVAMWIQFALLLITVVAAWTSVESRLAKVEQRMDDGVADGIEVHQQLNRIEQELINRTP